MPVSSVIEKYFPVDDVKRVRGVASNITDKGPLNHVTHVKWVKTNLRRGLETLKTQPLISFQISQISQISQYLNISNILDSRLSVSRLLPAVIRHLVHHRDLPNRTIFRRHHPRFMLHRNVFSLRRIFPNDTIRIKITTHWCQWWWWRHHLHPRHHQQTQHQQWWHLDQWINHSKCNWRL